jgi:glucokinase
MQPQIVEVLAGDIGGSKVRLAVAEVQGNQPQILREMDYPSRSFSSLDEIVLEFLGQDSGPAHAAFGIAGPVQGEVVRTTNLPWQIDAGVLRGKFQFVSCDLLNDLEATARGLPALGTQDVEILHAGADSAVGNMAIIAAGTGLGEAGLFWNGREHEPYATEGGHTSFSPDNELAFALLQFLQQRHGHVSWERVVSGMGLVAIHEFLRQHYGIPMPEWLQEQMEKGDAAEIISRAAVSGSDELCVKTLDWFIRLYGAEAGNLALKTMSLGGIYLGGGIAPKIMPSLRKGSFLEAFFNKGRMRTLLEAMPVRVILNDRAALYGAALYAARNAPK